MLWQAIIHSHRLAMMQQTDGAWRKIGSKQLMQHSRQSLLIQFSVTMCNVLREADMFQGVMSVSGFVLNPTGRTGTCVSTDDHRLIYASIHWYNMSLKYFLWMKHLQIVTFECYWVTSPVTFDLLLIRLMQWPKHHEIILTWSIYCAV